MSLVAPFDILSESHENELGVGQRLIGELTGTFSRGGSLPIIRLDHGRISFGTAHWGFSRPAQPIEYLRQCSGQSLGYPALIPACSIDIEAGGTTIRLTSATSEHLYIGTMYFQAGRGAQISAVPLVKESGPDVAPYSKLQPLLIPVRALPRSGLLDFISPHGAPHLRRPSAAGTLNIQLL